MLNIYYIFVSKLLPIILFIILSIWIYNKNNIKYLTISHIKDNYDFIIVGSGTAGCVLASKINENINKSVLLIEAGDQFNFLASVPLLTVLLQGTKYDWSYKSEPQKFSSFGFHNQIQSLPRGKGLGGSNQLNYMVHGYDVKDELENWISLGIKSWKYETLQSYFDTLFSNNSVFNITQSKLELNDLLFNAVNEADLRHIKYFPGQSTINFGKRWTSYHSHIIPALERNNLHIVLNTQVTKVIFDSNKHAIGVEIISNNYKRFIRNKYDIILSAGAFNTPQILLQSGIGPSHILKKIRIPLVADMPGVGKNLHDHFIMPLYVSITKPISVTLNKVLKVSELWNYLIHGEGVLSTTPNAGFVRQKDIGILLFGMGSTDENMFKNVANMKRETFESMFPCHKNISQEGFILLTTCLKPASRGYVSIQSSNPQNFGIINPQYLSNYKDIECMIRAVNLANVIINTTTFKNIGATIQWPKFSNCQSTHFDNEYLECIIRTGALTGYHPGGTCKMGPIEDQITVVDDTLKVKGMTGLRIMDASILPEPLPTYPNSVLIAMAEYATNMIKNELKN